jgi:hypothetical protein
MLGQVQQMHREALLGRELQGVVDFYIAAHEMTPDLTTAYFFSADEASAAAPNFFFRASSPF